MKNEIIAIIKDVAKTQKIDISINENTLNKPFKEMGVDSITMFGIIVAIEDKVGFQLPDAVLTNVKTINQLISAFESNKK